MSSYQSLTASRHQLPSWGRSGLIGKHMKASHLSRDKDLTIEKSTSLCEAAPSAIVQKEKMANLESTIAFLRAQHKDTLQHLHKEIERLKTENKELNFKLVMCRCGDESKSKCTSRQSNRSAIKRSSRGSETNDELKSLLIEDELRDLRNALHNERVRNYQLMRIIQHRIQLNFDNPADNINRERRELTIDECRAIIQKLKDTNEEQKHELMQLKADLQDVLFSDKWTPDAYLIARGYVITDCAETMPQQDDELHTSAKSRFPELIRRNTEVKEKAYQRLHESVHLPALRPRPNPASERHKRTLSLQRCRLETRPGLL